MNPELTDRVRLAGEQAAHRDSVDQDSGQLGGSCKLGLGGWLGGVGSQFVF